LKVAILGAGLIGTTSAWYLARDGHEVIVVDRQKQAGLETSFANGGQISVSHAEPWANPSAPWQLLKWLGRSDAPLLFRPNADWSQWLWGMRFLLECLPGRTAQNTSAAFALAGYSLRCLQELRRETGISYDESSSGILHIYSDPRLLRHAQFEAGILERHGLKLEFKTAVECATIEPALEHFSPGLAGGLYSSTDETGDAHLFTVRLSELARNAGAQFRFNIAVKRIETAEGRVSRVVIDDEAGIEESLRADAYVIALGSYTPLLLRPIGISPPIYPVKGYSITIPLDAGDVAPRISVTDHARKIVFTRLGERLRVAGTAELNGYNTELDAGRCEAMLQHTFELFPKAGRRELAQSWTGLRPATPSNLPCIGVSRYPNLYLNSGHGTLGWTMACGSGRALADIVGSKRPEPAFPFLLR
jgi:D-amino-acid dehydrogenase